MVARLAQLVELEETRNEAMKKMEIHQAQVKRSFDKRTLLQGVYPWSPCVVKHSAWVCDMA